MFLFSIRRNQKVSQFHFILFKGFGRYQIFNKKMIFSVGMFIDFAEDILLNINFDISFPIRLIYKDVQ